MDPGGNSQGDPEPPNPVDRWGELLEQIASDVAKIRGVITLAWWVGWIIFAVLILVGYEAFR